MKTLNIMIGQGTKVHAGYQYETGRGGHAVVTYCGSEGRGSGQVRYHTPVLKLTPRPVTCLKCLEIMGSWAKPGLTGDEIMQAIRNGVRKFSTESIKTIEILALHGTDSRGLPRVDSQFFGEQFGPTQQQIFRNENLASFAEFLAQDGARIHWTVGA